MALARDSTPKEIVLVESDFLFGLRKSDKRHAQVARSLEMHRSGKLHIQVLSTAVIEVRSVLYSRGLGAKEVEEFFTLMSEILSECGIETFVPTEPIDVIIAERLRAESPALTFFDSIYAAISKRLNLKLLSSEGIYSRIGLETIDLDEI
ncbi:MAG: hypothetical protein JRN15_19340 [Nitrososphaerota archaeon]|nr:hypothetical protein [Nitrososphaerota archaeon]